MIIGKCKNHSTLFNSTSFCVIICHLYYSEPEIAIATTTREPELTIEMHKKIRHKIILVMPIDTKKDCRFKLLYWKLECTVH